MTLAQAIERKQWDIVSLLLLISISEAAARLPRESLAELMDMIGGAEEGEAHGD